MNLVFNFIGYEYFRRPVRLVNLKNMGLRSFTHTVDRGSRKFRYSETTRIDNSSESKV